jgi:hypothetical protein
MDAVETKPGPDHARFADDATDVMDSLRQALADTVESLQPAHGLATELAAALRIDTKLAWKINRIVAAGDPFSAARYVPGPAGFRSFLRAAKRHGATRDGVARAQAAFERFAQLVRLHAGSRRAFDVLVAGHTEEDQARAKLEQRRAMFEGGSFVWGVQARVAFRADILAPSEDEAMFDFATIRGFVDLRRLRPNVAWRIGRTYSADRSGQVHTQFVRERIEPAPPSHESDEALPLMASFCSTPTPECRRVESDTGVEYELVEGAVGNLGSLTCVLGEIVRRTEPRRRTAEYPDFTQMFRLRTPAELAMFDVLIHRELFGRRITPEFIAYSDLFADRVIPRYRACDRLVVEEEIAFLGTGAACAATPTVERYDTMIRAAIERGGWNEAEFDVFRVRLRYPPIPSTLVVTHELPQPDFDPAG